MRWHRHGKYKTPLLLYEKQKLQESPTDPQFRGRVSLDGQLEMGDVSLTLVNATLEDSGEFICFVASEKSEDHASIHLTVKGGTNYQCVKNSQICCIRNSHSHGNISNDNPLHYVLGHTNQTFT